MNRTVFLDRDGVINEIVFHEEIGLFHSPKKISEVKLLDGVEEAVKLLKLLGLKIVVVSNQSLIARGLVDEGGVEEIDDFINSKLGGAIDAFYYCPHHPESHHTDIPPELMRYRIICECRKPKIGMIKRASEDLDIDLKNSFMVGDSTSDIKAGENSGLKTILVETGVGGKDGDHIVTPDFTSVNLLEASKLIERIVMMKTVILVGGEGERLRPLTENLPKPMLPIKGKPLLEYLVELNVKHGISEIIMSGHYMFNKIKGHFGDGANMYVKINYVDDGDNPLGSGGALKNCANLLPDDFIVMSGDVFTNIDLFELIKFHLKKGGIATLVVRRTDHPDDSDIIELDETSKAVKFHGKAESVKVGDIANASPFVFKKDILNFIPGGSSNLENEVVKSAMQSEKVYCYVNENYFIGDIGTFERYESVKNLDFV